MAKLPNVRSRLRTQMLTECTEASNRQSYNQTLLIWETRWRYKLLDYSVLVLQLLTINYSCVTEIHGRPHQRMLRLDCHVSLYPHHTSVPHHTGRQGRARTGEVRAQTRRGQTPVIYMDSHILLVDSNIIFENFPVIFVDSPLMFVDSPVIFVALPVSPRANLNSITLIDCPSLLRLPSKLAFLCPRHSKNSGGALSVTPVCACVCPSVCPSVHYAPAIRRMVEGH